MRFRLFKLSELSGQSFNATWVLGWISFLLFKPPHSHWGKIRMLSQEESSPKLLILNSLDPLQFLSFQFLVGRWLLF